LNRQNAKASAGFWLTVECDIPAVGGLAHNSAVDGDEREAFMPGDEAVRFLFAEKHTGSNLDTPDGNILVGNQKCTSRNGKHGRIHTVDVSGDHSIRRHDYQHTLRHSILQRKHLHPRHLGVKNRFDIRDHTTSCHTVVIAVTRRHYILNKTINNDYI
jgi:hypothetical protein